MVRCRGGLGLLVRCLRGSGFAGALPQGVSSCWCAASTFAGGGLRKASTGRLAAALVWGLGPWPASDARICVRALGLQGFCVCYGIPSPTQKHSTFDARRKNRGCPWGRGGQRFFLRVARSTRSENLCHVWPCRRWILHLYSAEKVSDPPPTTIQWQTHRSTLSTPTRSPRPRISAAPSRPVEALAERRSTRSRADAAAGRARSRVHAAAAPHPSAQYSSTLEVGPETISSSPVVTKVSAWA